MTHYLIWADYVLTDSEGEAVSGLDLPRRCHVERVDVLDVHSRPLLGFTAEARVRRKDGARDQFDPTGKDLDTKGPWFLVLRDLPPNRQYMTRVYGYILDPKDLSQASTGGGAS